MFKEIVNCDHIYLIKDYKINANFEIKMNNSGLKSEELFQ